MMVEFTLYTFFFFVILTINLFFVDKNEMVKLSLFFLQILISSFSVGYSF